MGEMSKKVIFWWISFFGATNDSYTMRLPDHYLDLPWAAPDLLVVAEMFVRNAVIVAAHYLFSLMPLA